MSGRSPQGIRTRCISDCSHLKTGGNRNVCVQCSSFSEKAEQLVFSRLSFFILQFPSKPFAHHSVIFFSHSEQQPGAIYLFLRLLPAFPVCQLALQPVCSGTSLPAALSMLSTRMIKPAELAEWMVQSPMEKWVDVSNT